MKSIKYIILIASVGVIASVGYFYIYPKMQEAKQKSVVNNIGKVNTDAPKQKERETGNQTQKNDALIVKEVLEGDLFIMSDGSKLRLLGIETPAKSDPGKFERQEKLMGRDEESIRKLGVLATEYVKGLAEGKKVNLVNDPDYFDTDQFKHLLRYVYLEDGTFLNEKILRDGYAKTFYDKKISKNEEFLKVESEAKKNKSGLWGVADGYK